METLLRIVQNEYTQMTIRQLGVVENCSELKLGMTNRLFGLQEPVFIASGTGHDLKPKF